MMELFTLGASDESGYPYSEDDVREQARALTGWTAEWVDDVGYTDFHFESERHDDGKKTIFGQTGAFDWSDSCRLCVSARGSQELLREQALELLHPDRRRRRKTRKALEHLYVQRDHAIRPVLEAILMHPDFYRGPAMVKPPVVYIAGLLRARRRGIAERLVVDLRARRPAPLPPAERRRLGRHALARHLDLPRPLDRRQRDRRATTRSTTRAPTTPARRPKTAVRRALAFWGDPQLAPAPARAWSVMPARSPPRRPPTGSRRPSACCARTRCAC